MCEIPWPCEPTPASSGPSSSPTRCSPRSACSCFDGAVSGVVLLVALLAIIGTAIYGLAGEKVNDGAAGIGGGTTF